MTTGRATNLEELATILNKLFTDEGVAKGNQFQPRPDDVIISPYSKCGTTWMQQIAHGLRTRGSMDFEEITEVTPWIDAAHDLGLDLEAVQVGSPRLYKSHAAWGVVPSGARYICVLRHPFDAVVSLYNFFDGWLMEPGSIEFENFVKEHYLRRRAPHGYWHHLVSWCQQRENPDVLLLCYEHLKVDFDRQLQRVAAFLRIELDDELFDIVKEQSSLSFMKAHNSHFNDHLLRNKRDEATGTPPSNTSKVASGVLGAHRDYFSTALTQLMTDRWTEVVTPELDWNNYEELLEAMSA
ncbi:MAG: hypothetical protein ACI9GW_003580 [Halieaceae bacterium]|jgi:hypothetical protein